MENLETQLKDLAMSMTEEEYSQFVLKPLIRANCEKLRIDIEKFEVENPEIAKAIKENENYLIECLEKSRQDYIAHLQEENKRLEEELKRHPIDFSQIKPPKKL